MTRREQYDAEISPLLGAMAYATRVVARMPTSTAEELTARHLKYLAIMREQRAALRRWNPTD